MDKLKQKYWEFWRQSVDRKRKTCHWNCLNLGRSLTEVLFWLHYGENFNILCHKAAFCIQQLHEEMDVSSYDLRFSQGQLYYNPSFKVT